MPNERILQATHKVFRQFTLRQSLVILTVVAALAGILRHLRLDSIELYGFLLAPMLVYAACKLLGVVLVPARWIARRLVVIVCGILFLALWIVGLTEHLALVLYLPLASVWIAQLVVVSAMESALESNEDELKRNRRPSIGDWMLGATGLALLLSALIWLGAPNYKNGTGTAGNRYWYVASDLSRTEIQWENNYAVSIPWTWGPLAQSRLTDAIDEVGFLGIVRYRIGQCEKLRFPNWLVVTLVVLGPIATVIRLYHSRANS